MVSAKTISRTIKSTENFWSAMLLKVTNRRKTIKFRNGGSVEVNWAEFCKIRDLFDYLHAKGFTYTISGEEHIVSRGKLVIREPSLKSLPLSTFFDFMLALQSQNWAFKQVTNNHYQITTNRQKFRIQRTGDDVFFARSEDIQLVGPADSLMSYFTECEKGVYDYDYKEKTVLDVGGFCGETAVFFASKGAKKIIVYEPVIAHHEFIKKNLELNDINAELHEEGIGDKDETVIMNYQSTNLGFGLANKGKNKLEVKIRNLSDVLEQSKADVAKIDCEGSEISLVRIPTEVLRKIKIYFIETHSPEIRTAIEKKFSESNFKLLRKPLDLDQNVSMLPFEILNRAE